MNVKVILRGVVTVLRYSVLLVCYDYDGDRKVVIMRTTYMSYHNVIFQEVCVIFTTINELLFSDDQSSTSGVALC